MQLKIGLIGCGDIGSLRVAALAKSPRLKLQAVSDVDIARAGKIARASGAEVEQDWRSLLLRSDVDALIVSTPPHLHAEMCMEALRAGKHVLCEKPLARSPEECRKILDAAAESGRFLATGFNYRFYPSFEAAREWLVADHIGKMDHIRSYAGYSADEHNHPWVHDASITGGGALRDNGIHLIDLTRFLMGEVTEVNGYASNSVWKFKECEDNGFLMMRSPGGAVASLHASWTEWKKYRFTIDIYGDRGCIRASCFPMFAELLQTAKGRGKARREVHRFAYTNLMEHLRSYRWVVVESLAKELEAFAAAIRNEASRVATGYDGLRAVEIASAASKDFE